MSDDTFTVRLLRPLHNHRWCYADAVRHPMPARALTWLFFPLLVGCQTRSRPQPIVPTPVEAPAPVVVNSPPQVSGDFLCIGPQGRRHVFPLHLVDPDGDRLTWRAEAADAHGDLYPRNDSGLASPADVEIVYEPPADRPEETTIVLTVTDARGAATVVHLIARSG
jgi:hypothetical protein